MYKLSGVHHIAVGIRNLETMRAFYRDVLGLNRVFGEYPDTEHVEMAEVVRDPHPAFAPLLLYQEAGGIVIELVRMTNPPPRPIRRDFRYGDIGVNKFSILVSDVDELARELKGRINFCSGPKSGQIPGWGGYRFVHARDPEGNLIEFFSSENLPVKGLFGGVQWVGVSVTDLDRSIAFYRKYGGLDKVFIPTHESYSGQVDEISGGKSTGVRSCVLAGRPGGGMVELFEVSQPHGRSIPFAARWGDYGYLQVCFIGEGAMSEMAADLEGAGLEFLCQPTIMGDEPPGSFVYLKDPDGIPVECLIFLNRGE